MSILFQAEIASFPIFSDDENEGISTKSFVSSLLTSSRNPLAYILAPLEDKENVPAKNFRMHAQILQVDSFSSSSSSMDTKSPMVLDTSVQENAIHHWRARLLRFSQSPNTAK
jgi:hypothetical protein